MLFVKLLKENIHVHIRKQYIIHVYSVYKYNALTDEEIVMAASRLDEEEEEEDDELVADKPSVSSHSEAYECLSNCIQWLEAQTDSNPVALQLLRQLSYNSVSMWATKLMYQCITKFFC